MNRVLEPTTTDARKEEIAEKKLLNRQFLFTKDKEDFYIKYNNKLVPIGGRYKQNYLSAGDNIEIIRDTSKEQNHTEVVRLLDDIDINTCELGKFSDTYRWKGTTKLGELHNSQILLPLTKYTKVGESYDEKALIGGEILVKLTNDSKNLTDYFQGALTLSSTGSWSLKGTGSTDSNVRMCRMKHKDTNDIYYGLKMPAAVARLPETSQEKSIVDTLYEEDETYYETEISEVQTKYQDDYFIGMAGINSNGIWQHRYDDRNYLALCNNSSGIAVTLTDTKIVPSDETNQNYHWQYCSFSDLMNLRGEEIVDDGTNIYDYVTRGYYLYLKVYWTNSGGNSTSATDNIAITDIYVCNTSGNYDPLLYPNRVVEHFTEDSNWFNFNENLKEINIESGTTTTNSYEFKLLRADMSDQFYLISPTNQRIQLSTTNMSNGYNYWYYISLDTIVNPNTLGTTASGSLAEYAGKGYYLYLYIYRRIWSTNYSVRITQVAITNRVMSTAPSNGVSGVIANYGTTSQNWVTFNSDLVTNTSGKYANMPPNNQLTFASFLDVISTETVTSTLLNTSNNFVTYFGDFNFITTALKEHEVEKTRTVPKISQEEVWTNVDYSSYWKDVYLYRSEGTTFTLQNESGASLSLTQAFQSNEYNYWYYAKLDDVIDLAGRITDLEEDDNLTDWYGKGYYVYLRIYRRSDTNYAVRITSIAITNAVLGEEEPSTSASLVLDMQLEDQDWIELNAAIVTERADYYYNMEYSTRVVAFSITQKGKKYIIQEDKFEDVEVWFNGWKVIPKNLTISKYEDADFEYVVLSDKSNDNDSYAETRYYGSVETYMNELTGLPSMQDTGEDNAPYKIIITQEYLTLEDLKNIAYYVKHLERQVALDLGNCKVADDAKEWSTSIFEGCVSLREMIIPQGVEVFGQGIFKWCTYLRKLDLTPSENTLTAIGGTAWEQNSGFLVSTRVTTLMLPKSITLLRNYLIYSSNIKSLIFLHDSSTGLIEDQSHATASSRRGTLSASEWAFIGQTGYGSIVYDLPEGFHIFFSKTFWEEGVSKGNNAGQPNKNGSGWDWYPNTENSSRWNKKVIDSIAIYPQDGTQEEWQEFEDKYHWGEDLINEVRAKWGHEDAIEIKERVF